jgi:hypothetical protein
MFHEEFSVIASELCDAGHLWEARRDGRADTKPTGTFFDQRMVELGLFVTHIPCALVTSWRTISSFNSTLLTRSFFLVILFSISDRT